MAKETTPKEEKQDDPILGLVVKRFEAADSDRNVYSSKWDVLYKLYRFQITKKVDGKSNLFIPYAFSNVETVYPRMVAKRPQVKVLPRGQKDVDPAVVMKTLIDYSWDKYKIDEIVRRWVKTMLIYGTGVVKVNWKKEVRKYKELETELNPDNTVKSTKEVAKSTVTYDGPSVTNLDLRSIYFDPDGVDVDSCRYIIHRYMATKTDLEANPNYKAADIESVTYGYSNTDIRRGLKGSSRPTFSKTECEVLEYWEDDRLIVIAGGVILRNEPNPNKNKKKPFVLINDHLDDQVIYGVGEVEPVEGLQNEMNTLRNMRMDMNTLSLNPPFIVLNGAVQDLDMIKFQPGWKIPATRLDAVRPMELPQAPATSYKEEESIKQDLQTVTGVSDYAKGNESASLNDTATGISLIQEAANQRFNAKLQNMESGLQRLGEQLRDLWLQYGTDEIVIRITEKDGFSFKTIKPEDIQGEFDISIEAGSTTPSNKLQERSEEMNKYNVMTANPLIENSPKAMLEITRALLEKWNDPSKDNIIEALTEEVSRVEQKRKEGEMQQEAQRQAQLMVGNSMKGENGSPVIPDGQEEVPQQFKDMAMQMLGGENGGSTANPPTSLDV